MRLLGLCTSAIALAWSSMATAQGAPVGSGVPPQSIGAPSATSTPPPQAATNASAEGGPAQGPSATAVGEIVVTAQRRSERLVDVPISVATVTSQQLTAVDSTSLANVTKLVPGTSFIDNGFAFQPFIRGIGTTLQGAGYESPVALYVDGVYQADQTANTFDPSSLSGLEILKGPQGTLFGRNATGGAILITTRDPAFKQAGDAFVSYGSYDRVQTDLYFNQPITDTLAANGSVAYTTQDGLARDLRTDKDSVGQLSYNARVKLLWKPTSDFSLILTGVHAEQHVDGANQYTINNNTVANAFPQFGPYSTSPDLTSADTKYHSITRSTEGSARATLETGLGTVKSVTAYHFDRTDLTGDPDYSYAPIIIEAIGQDSKVFTQELTLTSKPSQLSYVAGIYYFNHASRYLNLDLDSPIAPSEHLHASLHAESIAGFADGTYKLGNFSLIAGLRYTYETDRLANGFGLESFKDVPDVPYQSHQQVSYDSFTPRAGLRYSFDPNTNVYATYTRGFKSGGFNSAELDMPAVRPEKVDAYELGFKTSKGRFSFNAAAFYYDYSDLQVVVYAPSTTGLNAELLNAASARIYGVDLDGTARVSDSIDLHLTFSYLNTKYNDFKNAPTYAPVVVPGLPVTFGNTEGSSDVSGDRMIRAPRFTTSSEIDFHKDVFGHRLLLSLIPYYTSAVKYSFNDRLFEPGYFNLDSTLTYKVGNNVTLGVYARNMTDKQYNVFRAESALGDYAQAALGRQVGGSLALSF